MNVIELIHQALKNTIHSTFGSQVSINNVELTINTDPSKQDFGDLSSNCALILAKQLDANTRAVAQQIKDNLKHEFIENIEIAGPGFLNIFLTPEAYKAVARQLSEQGPQFFKHNPSTKEFKKFCIEFVSANPTGPLHIGHGRGGIIGDVLSRILTFLGHPVTKEFYINDAGAQIQKLGNSFKIRCQQQAGMNVELPEDAYQGEYLITFAQEEFNKYGAELLSKPDDFFINHAKEHLLAKIQETLKEYGIEYDVWFSEKTLHSSGAIEQALALLQQKNYLYENDNAVWFKSTEFGDDKDRVVKKNTGELTYVAADIAYVENKIKRGHDQLIYILGQDHHSYVQRLKGVIEALGYDPARLDVILYQLVTIKEGDEVLKLSKRAGRIVDLNDVIFTVGRDVARFFYLHKKADAHLEFDLKLALQQTEENPVYYVQYAYVRTLSILTKAQTHDQLTNINHEDHKYIDRSEKILLKKIVSLKNLLNGIEHHYQTHLLTYYVIELAQAFHSYYSHNRVIELDNINQSRGRLLMIMLIRDTLKTSFDLLGISAPEKM